MTAAVLYRQDALFPDEGEERFDDLVDTSDFETESNPIFDELFAEINRLPEAEPRRPQPHPQVVEGELVDEAVTAVVPFVELGPAALELPAPQTRFQDRVDRFIATTRRVVKYHWHRFAEAVLPKD